MVRLADSPRVEVDVHVAAPPERVWALVSDITVPTRFGGELYEVEWLDGAAGPALGATFVGRNRNENLGSWETVSRICEYQPELAFGWEVRAPQGDFSRPVASWRFQMEPEDGGTRLRQSVTIGSGASYLSRAIEAQPEHEEQIVTVRMGMLEQGIRSTLEGVKKLAES
ncbi:SRPBCC family protein [Streptantibioticus rubrisoli]|uniref:SRPBCC family protein n=1 Tax=Streptantibioticus rubrisoli TaxID=1387313 RepID=A0ABT1PH89_9ACTN|nr:SRPBCC family protein [Streptantibioticus rubrisoli]MCQ4044740.1 SRPBCC family protein [Streptantibioticus rubrisoli]